MLKNSYLGGVFYGGIMSINSINHDQIKDIVSHWEEEGETEQLNVRSAEARRRIEMIREIRESGLTLEEAEELGLLDL